MEDSMEIIESTFQFCSSNLPYMSVYLFPTLFCKSFEFVRWESMTVEWIRTQKKLDLKQASQINQRTNALSLEDSMSLLRTNCRVMWVSVDVSVMSSHELVHYSVIQVFLYPRFCVVFSALNIVQKSNCGKIGWSLIQHHFIYFYFVLVLEVIRRALHVLDKCSIPELYSQPQNHFICLCQQFGGNTQLRSLMAKVGFRDQQQIDALCAFLVHHQKELQVLQTWENVHIQLPDISLLRVGLRNHWLTC